MAKYSLIILLVLAVPATSFSAVVLNFVSFEYGNIVDDYGYVYDVMPTVSLRFDNTPFETGTHTFGYGDSRLTGYCECNPYSGPVNWTTPIWELDYWNREVIYQFSLTLNIDAENRKVSATNFLLESLSPSYGAAYDLSEYVIFAEGGPLRAPYLAQQWKTVPIPSASGLLFAAFFSLLLGRRIKKR